MERLKTAVDKALERRENVSGILTQKGTKGTVTVGDLAVPQTGATHTDPWVALEEIDPERRVLERERIVTRHKSNPAHVAFDSLRTRLLRALRDHDWTRVAITSPTKGCGKTMASANLAFSLARQLEIRTMLIDMDLRIPCLARRLGIDDSYSIEDLLIGRVRPEDFLRRIGANLAVGLNQKPVNDPAELMQSGHAADLLAGMLNVYRPNVVIYDLPPMLLSDDVIAFLPNVDAVLLIAAAGQTRPAEISECERMIAEHSQFLGVLLNKSTEAAVTSYTYKAD